MSSCTRGAENMANRSRKTPPSTMVGRYRQFVLADAAAPDRHPSRRGAHAGAHVVHHIGGTTGCGEQSRGQDRRRKERHRGERATHLVTDYGVSCSRTVIILVTFRDTVWQRHRPEPHRACQSARSKPRSATGAS